MISADLLLEWMGGWMYGPIAKRVRQEETPREHGFDCPIDVNSGPKRNGCNSHHRRMIYQQRQHGQASTPSRVPLKLERGCKYLIKDRPTIASHLVRRIVVLVRCVEKHYGSTVHESRSGLLLPHGHRKPPTCDPDWYEKSVGR